MQTQGSFFILSKTFISSAQKAMPPAATSKPGIVHNPDLVSLYNGCYLYEGQFVYSTCSFNKRKFYKKKKKSKETLLCLALLKGKGGGVPTVGALGGNGGKVYYISSSTQNNRSPKYPGCILSTWIPVPHPQECDM